MVVPFEREREERRGVVEFERLYQKQGSIEYEINKRKRRR